jgi:ABC-type polysaccharide/polyol phosphate export permease
MIVTVIVSAIFLLIGYSVFHHHRDRFSDLV